MTSCPSCGVSLPASAVAEGLGAARCPACRTLIDLETSRPAVRRAITVAQPKRWQVDVAPGSLSVRWRWFGPVAFFLVPFTLFWNGLMAMSAFTASERFAHPERLLIGLAVPHVWVGLGLGYYCLTLFFNATTVKLSEGQLTVKHAPLWWFGNRTVPARDVSQVFVVEKRGSKGSLRYEVCALLRDGRRQALVTGLTDEAEARFLEVRLEQVLNLVDQPVDGELRR
jgi:hypothetical protein